MEDKDVHWSDVDWIEETIDEAKDKIIRESLQWPDVVRLRDQLTKLIDQKYEG